MKQGFFSVQLINFCITLKHQLQVILYQLINVRTAVFHGKTIAVMENVAKLPTSPPLFNPPQINTILSNFMLLSTDGLKAV